ncbi:MAG TPA: signal peptide peptidase SppA [Methylomusa anaerophila]|uniref:Putative signal peptide peptidase SppA n=2 Tax=Methylomusa anaerophila TaxID=1930071 RepID=A0A348AJG4_9FIRM|nr:signal peptide peptidase SppA [Methylomusa anaerophila]BBB91212.1 putative signal peptide peptidase SppA [Methylomusa anaerophila]HML89793.1 signal peptide peptidase SppA [Methylomusa anaerophila]
MYKKSVVLFLAFIVVISMVIAIFTGPGLTKKNFAGKDKIAVIYVDGVIIGGRGQGGLFGETGGTDAIIKQIHAARDDQSVKAVILRINSPGGSAPASQEVGDEVKKLKATGKPVVTSMGDMAASGGYWIAACSDRIYANAATLTGSIGVYMPYTNWEELYKKIGIKQEKIKSGPHKDILSPERSMTPEERDLIQAMVDDMYNQFVEVVAQGRRMDPEKVRQLADGRLYTGRQAKEAGLVDELGNMYDAIEGTAQLAGIPGKPEIVEYGKTSLLAVLLGAEERLDLGKVLLKQLGEPPLLVAPMAMPQSWQ